MHVRPLAGVAVWLAWVILPVFAADGTEYHIKMVDQTPAPKEVPEPVRKLLGERCVQLLGAKDDLLAEMWFRKDMPVKATEAQINNGLTYAEVPETTLFGVIRFPKQFTDYRKQKIPAGVYTLRLANQPMDGDHMGTAPDPYFALLVGAAKDKQTAPLKDGKQLFELSSKSIGKTHAGVFLLFPLDKAPAEPKLVNKGSGTWAVEWKETATAGGQTAALPIALTLVGHTSAE